MTDEELMAGFEAGTLAQLAHAEHVRVALLYLDRHGRDDALGRLADGLRRFATVKGHPEKFHVTMTRAWLDLLDAARQSQPAATPADVVRAWPELLNPHALRRFYSTGRLETHLARASWVEPDLAPLEPMVLRVARVPIA